MFTDFPDGDKQPAAEPGSADVADHPNAGAQAVAGQVGEAGGVEPFEGHAFAGYEDYGNDADDFYGRVGALVKFNPNWGVSGDVKFADGDTQWFVGPRYSW